jgi:hypothetical protein
MSEQPHMATAHTIKKDQIVDDTIVDKKWYNEDEVTDIRIEAFQAGVKHTKEQLKTKLNQNQEKAKEILTEIYLRLNQVLKVKAKMIKLRPVYYNSFESIFIIPPKDFLSQEQFTHVSMVTEAILRKYNGKDFNLSALFMPSSTKINEEAMFADGFNLTFGSIR